jgi:hypothetical protein
MDYQKIYNSLIERARSRKLLSYTERHHVLPRCQGGSDEAENLVDLTPEEHYVAHQLLVKLNPGHEGLLYAAQMMGTSRPGSRQYGWIKRQMSEYLKARAGAQHHSRGCINITDGANNRRLEKGQPIPAGWRKGWTHSPESRAKMSRSHSGKKMAGWSEERRKKFIASRTGKKYKVRKST